MVTGADLMGRGSHAAHVEQHASLYFHRWGDGPGGFMDSGSPRIMEGDLVATVGQGKTMHPSHLSHEVIKRVNRSVGR